MIDSRHRQFLEGFVKAVGLNHSLHNVAIAGWLVALYSVVYVVQLMPIGFHASTWGMLGMAVGAIAFGMHTALLLDTVRSVAGGDDVLPEFAEFSNWQDSIASPIVQALCTVTFLLGPWFVWKLVAPHTGIDLTVQSVIPWALGIGGLLLIPIGYVALAYGGLGAVIRYDMLVRAVVRTPVAYVMVLVLVVFTGSAGYALLMSRAPAGLSPPFPLAQSFNYRVWRVLDIPVLAETVFVYISVVLAITLGQYQRHFGDRFPWSSE